MMLQPRSKEIWPARNGRIGCGMEAESVSANLKQVSLDGYLLLPASGDHAEAGFVVHSMHDEARRRIGTNMFGRRPLRNNRRGGAEPEQVVARSCMTDAR